MKESVTTKYKKGENSSLSWWFVLVLGIIVRVVLFLTGFHQTFSRRVEINSPVTSWYRVTECNTLSNHGISPYDGDICHQPPLLVLLFKKIHAAYIPWCFVVIDTLTSLLLYFGTNTFTRIKLIQQEENRKSLAKDVYPLLLNRDNLRNIPLLVMAIYLLCPYSIVTCIAQSTVVINNLVNAAVFFTMLRGWFSLSCLFVMVSAYLSLYPVMLLAPVVLMAYQRSNKAVVTLPLAFLTTLISTFLLLLSSYYVNDSWNFLHAVYGFVLEASDLTPNMGLFWYFFMEMFDHFRLFFLCVYQLNVFIYVIPLLLVFRKRSCVSCLEGCYVKTLKSNFRKHPLLIFYTLLSLTTLFKSYSTFGDVALPIALLPLWSYAYRYMRNVLLIFGMFLFTTVLAPLMWYLWIYAGSGNANFFYAVTLAYNTAQVFLLSDVLYAVLRYDFHLINGLTPKTPDGEKGNVVMQ